MSLPGRFLFSGVGKMLSSCAGIWKTERRCLMCAVVFKPVDASAPGTLLCSGCRQRFARREKGFCPLCGELSLWEDLPVVSCIQCSLNPPPWQGLIFHGAYSGLLRHALLALKFHSQPAMGYLTGRLLAEHPALAELRIDAVVPVPLHAARLALRGYNQAMEIAKPLAKHLCAPLHPLLLNRVKATLPQTGKSLQERRKNILNAFSGSNDVQGMHILLVDDIITTGATLRSAASVLRKAGAISVYIAAAARTPKLRRKLNEIS